MTGSILLKWPEGEDFTVILLCLTI